MFVVSLLEEGDVLDVCRDETLSIEGEILSWEGS